jgi:hypothetical protein
MSNPFADDEDTAVVEENKSNLLDLPQFWEEHYNETHASHFYYNTKTGETTWTKPLKQLNESKVSTNPFADDDCISNTNPFAEIDDGNVNHTSEKGTSTNPFDEKYDAKYNNVPQPVLKKVVIPSHAPMSSVPSIIPNDV